MRQYLDFRGPAKDLFPEWARVGEANRCASRDAAQCRKSEIEEDDDGRGDESEWGDEATENWGDWRRDFARVRHPSRDSDFDNAPGPGITDGGAEFGEILAEREARLDACDVGEDLAVSALVAVTVAMTFQIVCASTNHLAMGNPLVIAIGDSMGVRNREIYTWGRNRMEDVSARILYYGRHHQDPHILGDSEEISTLAARWAPGRPAIPAPEISDAPAFILQHRENEGSKIRTDILVVYSPSPQKDSEKAMRAAVAAREGGRALLRNMAGVMALYIAWANARLVTMAPMFLSFGDVKIDLPRRFFLYDLQSPTVLIGKYQIPYATNRPRSAYAGWPGI